MRLLGQFDKRISEFISSYYFFRFVQDVLRKIVQ
jgi:hypothetical protein